MKQLTIAVMLFLLSLPLANLTAEEPIEFTGDVQRDLQQVDRIIADGPRSADWDDLKINVPQWYLDAKFGIFIHWGAYTVPAFGNEWYPRFMYIDKDQKNYGRGNYFQHHLKTFGPHKTNGYKDLIPKFKAEKFNAEEWAELFEASGAKYIVPVAEHHDGFPMYDCSFTRWNATKMGPKRDVIKELRNAVDRRGMYFGVSSHRAFNWMFYQRDESFDTVDPKNFDLYGKPHEAQYTPWENPWPTQSQEFKDNWLARTCELAEKYQPDLLWFDFGIGPRWIESPDDNPYKEYLEKFTAYYYNRAEAWTKDVAINYKWNAMPADAAVLDVERGKLDDKRERYWQTDTSVMFNSWSHIARPDYRTINSLVDDIIDITAKNGCLLLNIGPKADGTIPQEQKDQLLGIGKWLKLNGEAIYRTRPWDIYGEGPTSVADGPHSEKQNKDFSGEDIRFTTKGEYLYAIALAWPENGKLVVKSLKNDMGPDEIGSVTLLGHDGELKFSRNGSALTVNLPSNKPCEHAFAFRIAPK
jgi:alpha-L-fucosidase